MSKKESELMQVIRQGFENEKRGNTAPDQKNHESGRVLVVFVSLGLAVLSVVSLVVALLESLG
ncbi:MAG: hypothetical protein LBI43_00660 [Streptococcaceae bacterium]|jgi:hypothetical protein|nr:hypothetical protein [Streptococcaceae bacterium]